MTALADGLARFQSEASGMLELVVVQATDVPDLARDAAAGDDTALGLLKAVSLAFDQVYAPPKRKPWLCASCPQPLHKAQFGFGLVLPGCDNPMSAVAFGVCSSCGPDASAIRGRATEALRRLWPDLRPVTVTHEQGGRA